jgi:hypothetical protein
MIEVAVETNDVRTIAGNVHFPISWYEYLSHELREFWRQRIQLVTGNADISETRILRNCLERISTFPNVADGKYADAVYFRWLESAIAVSKNAIEKIVCASYSNPNIANLLCKPW